MRKPNHIILDFENSKCQSSNQYWAARFLDTSTLQPNFLHNLNINKKYIREKLYSRHFNRPSRLLRTQQKYTIILSDTHPVEFSKKTTRASLLTLFPVTKCELKGYNKKEISRIKRIPLKYSTATGRDAHMYLFLEHYKYSQRNLRRLYIMRRASTTQVDSTEYSLSTVLDLLNVNFLRKERLYTKLKYSRTPAYDIVSGGAAALLAGFIGFLISEKFGFELVDSGDFYFFFMYLVFIGFSVRPLLWAADPEQGFLETFGPRRVYQYYHTLVYLVLFKLRNMRK